MEENKIMGTDAVSCLQNATNGSHLVLMNIQDLKDKTFEIPAYQRGFRWRWQQVRELIDDLYEFCTGKGDKIYCLQTITVIKKDDNVYEVVDGQQRLTAIWMLVTAYVYALKGSPFLGSLNKLPIYNIKFTKKDELTGYCKRLSDVFKPQLNSIDIFNEPAHDIDSKFINFGLNALKNYVNSKDGSNYAQSLQTIFFGDRIRQGAEICIFWNEISNVQIGQTYGQGEAEAEEGANVKQSPFGNNQNGSTVMQSDDWAIERFSNLNAGKIPLTESELVKAYFIDNLGSNRVDEFSLQWEEIERGLSDEEFWGFLSSKEYETRIDLLLEIAYDDNDDKNSANKSHALSLTVAEKLKGGDAHTVWQKVVQCYQTLRDWYEDYFFYHMIGYIIAVDKKPSADIINALYHEYQTSTKEVFEKLLKKHVRNLELLKPIFEKREDKKSSGKKGSEGSEAQIDGQLPENSINLDDAENGLAYDKNKDSVKAVLLLFNVALLVNAYKINSDNAAERFSFKLYKSKTNSIEIEHINPKHLEGQNVEEAEKKDWARRVLKIIGKEYLLYGDLEKEVNEAKWGNQNVSLIERLEEAADLHDISNLTLLDKKLNASYKDNFFSEKRKHILAARFGYPVPKDASIADKDKKEEVYYKQSVIFPGTMWVFLREYQEEPADKKKTSTNDHRNQQQTSVNGSDDFWTKADRKKYIATMQDSIHRLLFK